MDSAESLVQIEDVSKSFDADGLPAIAALSASIGAGQLTGLVGPDGAGKTTLLRLIAGLLLPDSGRIRVDGLDSVADADAIHRLIGYMPQRFGLYEELSVLENLNLYADLRGVVGAARAAAYRRLLQLTALGDFTARRAGALSGGMRQKLGLACALLSQPRLLLLDEPSVGVDPISRRELWRMIERLVDDGIGVVWSTAYLDEAERCDRVLLLSDGRLLYAGEPAGLTGRVRGRSFLLHGAGEQRRQVLARALQREDVLDGVIAGRAVRLVTRAGRSVPAADELGGPDAAIEATPARFEDAFVDALGGGPGGISALAERYTAVDYGSAAVVKARGLTKRFGNFTAAADIEFDIRPGEIFGLLGPNGAGKSTTFRMLCGLLRPSSGRAEVVGLDLEHASSAARARIGYMAQKFSLYGQLSARQNLQFFASVYGLAGARRRRAFDAMVEIFGLQAYLDRAADSLPLGFKQRLALACAVMHEPAVLFLDEPTSGVDPITRREFWTHINGLVDKGVTIMVTTHFMDEAEYCDRISIVFRGRLIETGSPDELKARAAGARLPDPSLEDAFIELVRRSEAAPREAA